MVEPVETPRSVLVPYDRLLGWIERFSVRHGEPVVARSGTVVRLSAPDGAVATYDDVSRCDDFGLLLVRRGGYAVGRVEGTRLVAHKTGTRYVQGRTKAGGWSQQRYARRRANQADALVDAATAAAERVLPAGGVVFAGGDRPLVEAVTRAHRQAAPLVLADRWITVKDPRLADLQRAVGEVRSYEVRLNALA